MTIVPEGKIQQDPQRLLYHFPSIHPVKYTKMSRDYHYWKEVSAAEAVAVVCGKILVPGSCLHWERKQKMNHRRLQILKNAFYIMAFDELTNIERDKYLKEVDEGGPSDAPQAN